MIIHDLHCKGIRRCNKNRFSLLQRFNDTPIVFCIDFDDITSILKTSRFPEKDTLFHDVDTNQADFSELLLFHACCSQSLLGWIE